MRKTYAYDFKIKIREYDSKKVTTVRKGCEVDHAPLISKFQAVKEVSHENKFPVTFSSAEYKAENILNREFHSDKPQQKVLTDITEFKYGNNKLYMCATYDLFDKSILSYELSHTANTELILKVLKNSYSGDAVQGALLHSDRGIIHSMSRVGRCIDNGSMEGFFGNIKYEKYYLNKYIKLEELEKDIYEYSELHPT